MISKNAVILIGQIDAERALGKTPLGRCGGCQQLPFSADHVDGRIDCPWDDSDRADGVLGTDGIRDHGRPAGCDGPYAGLPADTLCGLVRVEKQQSRPFRAAEAVTSAIGQNRLGEFLRPLTRVITRYCPRRSQMGASRRCCEIEPTCPHRNCVRRISSRGCSFTDHNCGFLPCHADRALSRQTSSPAPVRSRDASVRGESTAA